MFTRSQGARLAVCSYRRSCCHFIQVFEAHFWRLSEAVVASLTVIKSIVLFSGAPCFILTLSEEQLLERLVWRPEAGDVLHHSSCCSKPPCTQAELQRQGPPRRSLEQSKPTSNERPRRPATTTSCMSSSYSPTT